MHSDKRHQNMENRVDKHLRLEINTSLYTYQLDQHLRTFLRGFEDVKNVQKISTKFKLSSTHTHTHDTLTC